MVADKGLSIECFEKTRRGVPLLPLQTMVDYELLYCGRQPPCLSQTSAPVPAQQPWPIGQDVVASDGADDDERSDEPSIFHELRTTVHTPRPDQTSTSGRPQSMFELPYDVASGSRGYSTATMSTGDATRDERTAAGQTMSDEARTAMLDCITQQSPYNSPPTSPTPGVPLAKVATELQAARQLTSKALTSIQPDDATTSTSEGKGDARVLQAGTSLYPAINSAGSARTLLDYYSARAAERTVQSPAPRPRHLSQVPRVTMSFNPSSPGARDDHELLASTPTPSPSPAHVRNAPPTTSDERSASHGPQTLAELSARQPVAAAHAPGSTATDRSVSQRAQPTVSERANSKQLKTQYPARRNQSAAGGLRALAPTTAADSAGGCGRQNAAAAAASKQNDKAAATTTTTTKSDWTPAASTVSAASTSKTAPPSTDHQHTTASSAGSIKHVHKPADRQQSEPLRASTAGSPSPQRDTKTSSTTRHSSRPISGAATDMFLSSILSHLVPVPASADRDWGHFTLVRPATTQDSKPTTVTNSKR